MVTLAVTPIAWLTPPPGGDGAFDFRLACVSPSQGRIYQFLTATGSNIDPPIHLSILDMDTCVELSRVAVSAGAYLLLHPVAVVGSDWVVATFSISSANRHIVCINAITGTTTTLPYPTLGASGVGRFNQSLWLFSMPFGSGKSIVYGHIDEDFIDNGQLPNASVAALTVDHATGALALVAFGNRGEAKTALYPTVDTLGETKPYGFVPGPSTATSSTVYYWHRQFSDGVMALPDGENRQYLYELSVTTSLVWSNRQVAVVEHNNVVQTTGSYYVANNNTLVYSYRRQTSVTNGADMLALIHLASGDILSTVETASGLGIFSTDTNSNSGIWSVSVPPDRFRFLHVNVNGKVFGSFGGTGGHSTSGVATDDIVLIDTSTLARSVWVSEAEMLAQYQSNAHFENFYDASRCAIFIPSSRDEPYGWARLTFDCSIGGGGGGGGGPVGYNSIATLTASIGQFTAAIRAVGEQPCEIIGSTSYGICITGRSSVPPGMSQVLCGLDDTVVGARTPQQVGWIARPEEPRRAKRNTGQFSSVTRKI